MILLLQRPTQHRLPVFRPAEAFRRWYGVPLQPHENNIIATLEAVRQCVYASRKSPLRSLTSRHLSPRVLVIDPPGRSSVALLTSYLSFLDALYPGYDHRTLIVDSSRANYRLMAGHGYPNARLITPRQGQSLRGVSYNRLLMLNIDRYRTFSPFHERPILWSRLYGRLVAPVSVSEGSIVILHTTLPRFKSHQCRRLEHLSRILPTVFNIQPDILERTRAFVQRILDHNRLLNRPVAIPLDWPEAADSSLLADLETHFLTSSSPPRYTDLD